MYAGWVGKKNVRWGCMCQKVFSFKDGQPPKASILQTSFTLRNSCIHACFPDSWMPNIPEAWLYYTSSFSSILELANYVHLEGWASTNGVIESSHSDRIKTKCPSHPGVLSCLVEHPLQTLCCWANFALFTLCVMLGVFFSKFLTWFFIFIL